MIENPFDRIPSLSDPARDAMPVVPDDSADLTQVAVALYIETAGDLRITTAQGSVLTVKVPDFMLLPIGVRRVHATGTTALGVHALFAG